MKPNVLFLVAGLFIAGWLVVGVATLTGLVSGLQPEEARLTFYADEIVVTAGDRQANSAPGHSLTSNFTAAPNPRPEADLKAF